MSNFADALNIFLVELRNNILQELFDNNTEYKKMKAEKEDYLRQLQDIVPSVLINDFIDAQYALGNFEINYCFLCGMRDRNKPDVVSPTGEAMSQEYLTYGKYRQLQAQLSNQHSELQAVLPSEYHSLLSKYIKIWDTISGLEKHYIYSGGMSDKAQLDRQFDPSYEEEWKDLTEVFL